MGVRNLRRGVGLGSGLGLGTVSSMFGNVSHITFLIISLEVNLVFWLSLELVEVELSNFTIPAFLHFPHFRLSNFQIPEV